MSNIYMVAQCDIEGWSPVLFTEDHDLAMKRCKRLNKPDHGYIDGYNVYRIKLGDEYGYPNRLEDTAITDFKKVIGGELE